MHIGKIQQGSKKKIKPTWKSHYLGTYCYHISKFLLGFPFSSVDYNRFRFLLFFKLKILNEHFSLVIKPLET